VPLTLLGGTQRILEVPFMDGLLAIFSTIPSLKFTKNNLITRHDTTNV